MRSADFLTAQQIDFDSLPHAPAFSASRRARWLRTPGHQVARSVLLLGCDGPFLVVLRSTHEIALDALVPYWGTPVRLTSVAEAATLFRDCEWGSIPAFGNLYGIPVLLDSDIPADEDIVFPIGSHYTDVRLSCRVFERLTGALRLELARPITRPRASA